MNNLFFELLQVTLGTREKLSRMPNAQEWERLYEEAENQAIVGILLTGLERLPSEQLPPLEVKLQWIGEVQIIQHENKVKDSAVVDLCEWFLGEDIRFVVVKGQTLAAIYPDNSLRQSGDIDFLVHPDDWSKAFALVERTGLNIESEHAEKHVEWTKEEVPYEMHHALACFARPRHQRYWENVIEPEIWKHPWTVEIEGYLVPTLFPVLNVLYVFVHIFEHFIKEGIGLRQIVDWFYLMENVRWKKEDVEQLDRWLNGIGLKKAFVGFGAVLTDYLGLSDEAFPFEISSVYHQKAPVLMKNILEMGNFGHNKGTLQGLKHIGRIWSQTWKFGNLAPAEVWWRIPHMFGWWGKKTWMMMK